MKKYGGIELGGTKMVCGIADENGKILDRYVIPTKEPNETLKKLCDYFKDKGISSLGIGSFGPIDLNKKSNKYGYITTTPKAGWENVDVLSCFKELNVPLGFDTDVNAACLGELVYGSGRDKDNVVYGTVGTGIGFGVYVNGNLIHGLIHPEIGHISIKPKENDLNHSVCKYHKNCLEGLASGPSIENRWGRKGDELYDDEKVWELEAYYLGQACANIIMMYSPEIIILGGGVMHTPRLVELVRKETLKQLNGYIQSDLILNHIEDYIVLPGCKDDAGLLGSIELGKMELNNGNNR